MSRILHGITVFFKQEKAIAHMTENKHSFMVGLDYTRRDGSTSKSYTSFPSEKEYEEWSTNFAEKTFYEIVQPESLCNEYYDLDDWKEKAISPKEMAELWYKARKEYGEYLYKKSWLYSRGEPNDKPVLRENVLVLNASKYDDKGNLTKGSLHIRHFGTTFYLPKEHKIFQLEFKDWIDTKPEYSNLKWDGCVYSRYRNIRMEGCTKAGQNRPLLRMDWFPCSKPSYITCNVDKTRIWTYIAPEDEVIQPEEEEVKKIEVLDPDDVCAEITHQIKDGSHFCCDTETGKNLTYAKSLSWWFSVRNFKGDKYLKDNWDSLYECYRHSNESQKLGQLNSILSTPISSDTGGILYWAKNITSFKTKNKALATSYYNKKKTEIVKAIFKLDNPNTIRHEDRYVNPEIYDDEHKGVLVCSGLGSGKSQSITVHINKNKYTSICVFTPRRSYAKSVSFRLKNNTNYDWDSYMDRKGFLDLPYTICQVESIHRIKTHFDLILIDECESFLTQLTSRETHGEHHIENIQTLEGLVKNCSKIILLDAFLTNRSLRFLNSLDIWDTITHEYTKLYNIRDATRLSVISEKGNPQRVESRNLFISNICSDLQNGKKLFIFCSSIKVLKDIVVPSVLKNIPALKYLLYHGKFATQPLVDVVQEWGDVECVFTTSTITVGIDYDVPDVFNKVYMYVSASSKNLIRDCFQASFRVRKLIDNELVYCIDTRSFTQSYGINKKNTKERIEYICSLFEGAKNRMPFWLRQIYIDNEHERNASINCIEQMVSYFLDKCGYQKKGEKSEFPKIKFDIVKKDIKRLEDIKAIPECVISDLEMKNTLTEKEMYEISKFYFTKFFDCSIVGIEEVWIMWVKSREKLYNLIREKHTRIDKDTEQDYINMPFPVIKNGYQDLDINRVKLAHIRDLNNTLGLENSCTGTISREKLESVLDLITAKKYNLAKVFDLKPQGKDRLTIKSGVEFLNSVYRAWGGGEIIQEERERKRIDGKEVIVSGFSMEEGEKWDYIK